MVSEITRQDTLPVCVSLNGGFGGGNAPNVCKANTSLVNNLQKLPLKRQGTWSTPKQRRLFQRTISGIELANCMKTSLRAMTLTSKPNEDKEMHRHFTSLVKRLRRRYGTFEYIQVKEFTKRGVIHYHIVYRGSYIPQRLLSAMWEDIHGSPIVYVQYVRGKKHKLAGYLTKYIAKDPNLRYGWSWNWVFKGFVAVWKHNFYRRFKNIYFHL